MNRRFTFAVLVFFEFVVAGCNRGPATPANEHAQIALPELAPFEKAPEPIWQERATLAGGLKRKGRVHSIEGPRAELSNDGGRTWEPAFAQRPISVDDIVRTDSKTILKFFLRESGPILTLGNLSVMRIARSAQENTGIEIIEESMIEIERGRLSGHVPKLAGASVFLIRTQKGIVEPHGQFEVDAEGMIRADGGRVHAEGTSYPITPGQEFLF